MRNLEIKFQEVKDYLLNRGEVFEEDEYINNITWQVEYPDRVLFVSIDKI